MANYQMVNRSAEHLCKGRLIRISYRRATFVVCACNLMVMLSMMYLTLSPLHLRKTSLPQLVMAVGSFNHKQTSTKEDMERMEASYNLRRALMPIHLIEEVKELQAETELDIKRTKRISAARQKQSIEVSQRLAQVKQSNAQSNQQGLQKWRKKKLQSAKRHEVQRQSGVSRWKELLLPEAGGRRSRRQLQTQETQKPMVLYRDFTFA